MNGFAVIEGDDPQYTDFCVARVDDVFLVAYPPVGLSLAAQWRLNNRATHGTLDVGPFAQNLLLEISSCFHATGSLCTAADAIIFSNSLSTMALKSDSI